jgi:hypothetical protein
MRLFGPRDEVLAKLGAVPVPAEARPRIVAQQGSMPAKAKAPPAAADEAPTAESAIANS